MVGGSSQCDGLFGTLDLVCTCVVRVNCLTGCGKKNGFVFLGVEMGVTREGRGRISSCKGHVCVCGGRGEERGGGGKLTRRQSCTCPNTANPNYSSIYPGQEF